MNICTNVQKFIEEHKMFKEVIKNKANLLFKLHSIYLWLSIYQSFDSSQQILQIKEYKVWFKKHDIDQAIIIA